MRSKTFLVETETEEEDGANVYGDDDESFNFHERYFQDEEESNVHGARQPGGHQNKGWPSPGK